MHPRMPLAFLATRTHCQLMVILSSTSTPRSLSTELLSYESIPNLYWCMGLFLPRCSTLHLPWLNYIRFLSAQLSSLSRSHRMAAAFRCISHSSQFCVISKLAECKLELFIQVIDEEVKQDWAQYWPLRDTTCYQPPTRLSAADDHSLSSALQPVLYPLLWQGVGLHDPQRSLPTPNIVWFCDSVLCEKTFQVENTPRLSGSFDAVTSFLIFMEISL